VNQSRALRGLNRMAGPDTGKNPPQSDAPNAPHTDESEDSLDFLGENVQGDGGEAAKDWPPPAGEEGESNCADGSEADDDEAFADKHPVNDAAQDANDAVPRALFKPAFEE
jgi:hypothetical protein